MTATAFGPQGPNYTTTRPAADPQASAGADTWFKNCSAAGAKDGTFATAAFFNVTIGNIRYLVRTATITLDDTDDTMVYRAVKKIADDEFNSMFAISLNADQGIKINATTKYIESTLGDGTRPALTSSTGHPATDVLDIFDKTANVHAEMTPYQLMKAVIASGTGISLSFDAGAGKVIITNSAPSGGGGGGLAYAKVPYCVAAGTSPAITADFSPDIASPGAGDLVAIKLLNNITGATTMQPDGGTVYDMVDSAGVALVNLFAAAGEILLLMYDGTKWRVMNKQAPSTVLPSYVLFPGIGSYYVAFSNAIWTTGFPSSPGGSGTLTALLGTWKCISQQTDQYVINVGDGVSVITYRALYQRIA